MTERGGRKPYTVGTSLDSLTENARVRLLGVTSISGGSWLDGKTYWNLNGGRMLFRKNIKEETSPAELELGQIREEREAA